MKNLKISNKIFLSYVIISLLTVSLISYIFYNILKNALIQKTIDQLTSVNILKRDQIESYYAGMQKDLEFLLKKNTSEITVGEIKKLYQFENMVLADDNLTIVFRYTDIPFFQNIREPEFRKYFAGIKNKKDYKVHMADISAFSKNGNTVILYFIPYTYLKTSETTYLLILDDFKKIQEILNENTGMGNSGETYLVGNDFRMRSTSRFFPARAPLTIRVETVAAQNGIKEQSGKNIISDYRGIEVISIYKKINVPGISWAIISEMDMTEAMAPIIQLRNYLLIITAIIFVVIILATLFISNAISQPILKLKNVIADLSKGIIPDNKIYVLSDDEIGQITSAINELVVNLKSTRAFAHEIGKGNFNATHTPLSEKDTLGMALINMRDKLKTLNEREIKLIRERASALMEGQENERKRITRELHDGIGQLLTATKLRAELIEDQDDIKSEIKSLINETITEVRRLSYNILPGVLVDFGLGAALKDFCENVKKYSGLKINFTCQQQTENSNVNFEIRVAVFRIIQEALNNIIKHAQATIVDLNIIEKENEIAINLKDNGKGFDKEQKSKGFGLLNMNERANLLNGSFIIRSNPGSGTSIEIKIPLPSDNN
ncbi:MAG: hypothetical protein K2X86_10835 [Cytophagaceae bacterium]|nr:hypothetical protein [Cytophagaceae bacterium]